MLNFGELICDQNCSTSDAPRDCDCKCPAIDAMEAEGTLEFDFLYDIMVNTSLWDKIGSACSWCIAGNAEEGYTFFNLTTDQNYELVYAVVMLACHPGHVSQMGTPLAGPNDPLFWPIHGAFERITDYLRLVDNSTHDCDDGGANCRSSKITWGYGIDDADDCAELGANHTFTGQGFTDLLPFDGFLGDTGDKFYSNQQLWELFDPLNPRLTYIYDSFAWDHCHG